MTRIQLLETALDVKTDVALRNARSQPDAGVRGEQGFTPKSPLRTRRTASSSSTDAARKPTFGNRP